MKNILRHPWIVAAGNLVLVLALYTILRLVCYAVNGAMFPDIDGSHLWEILCGGVRFDLTAVLYLSSLYILGILLPLPAHWRMNSTYQKVLAGVFMVPNAIGLAVNTADIAYIPFTDRRTTCTFFTEFANDGNLWSIFAQGVVQYWPVTLAGLLVLAVLFVCTRKTFHVLSVRPILYYPLETAIMLLTAYFVVIGIRGGFGKYTRPITLSNALQYADRPQETLLVLNTPFSIMRSTEGSTYTDPKYYDLDELERIMSPIHKGNELRSERMN